MKCKNPDRSTSIVRWRYFYRNCSVFKKSCSTFQGAYVAASTVCKQRLYDPKSTSMVLYFNAEENNNWGDVRNWWKDSFYTSSADFVPRKIDTAVINATCNVNSKGGAVVYDLIVNDPNEQGFVLNVFVSVKNLAIFNGHSTNLGMISGTAVFNDYSINNGDILGDAYFYDYSVNNSVDSVYKDAFFSNFSLNNGTVRGSAFFKDSSSNSPNGIVEGFAFFADSSTNLGTVLGGFVFEQFVSGGAVASGETNTRIVILGQGGVRSGGSALSTINCVARSSGGSLSSGTAKSNVVYNFIVPFFAGGWTDQSYSANTVVSFEGLYYICLQSFFGDHAVTPEENIIIYEGTRWAYYTNENNGLISGLSSVITNYKLDTSGGCLVSGISLQTFSDVITPSGGSFVGGISKFNVVYNTTREIIPESSDRTGVRCSGSADVLRITTISQISYGKWMNGGEIFRNGMIVEKLYALQNYSNVSVTWTITNITLSGVVRNLGNVGSTIVNQNNLVFRDDGYGLGVANAVDFLNGTMNAYDLDLSVVFRTNFDNLIVAENHRTSENWSITIREDSSFHSVPVYYVLRLGDIIQDSIDGGSGFYDWSNLE